MKVISGDVISGVAEEGGWVLAFRDVSPNQFGFVPKNYMKFERRTNEPITPRSEMGRSQTAKSVRDLSPETQVVVATQVKDFLADIYNIVADDD